MRLEGDLHLDGVVEGAIRAVNVSIGKAGVLKGEIVAGHVTVSGRIEGKLRCELLELLDGCHVMGEVQCVDLVVEKGARFVGSSRDMHAAVMVEQDLLPSAPESALNPQGLQ